MTSELRQRRTNADPRSSQSSVKDGVRRRVKRLDEVQECLQLATFQIAFGLLYASVLAAMHNLESLAGWRDFASWFTSVQHMTSWGRAHAGYRDFALVISGFVGIISARAVSQFVILGLCRKNTFLSPKSKVRLTEQGWSTIYYGGMTIAGLYLLKNQPYGWNAATLWQDFPHYYIDPSIKVFYLVVLAYWLSQLFIIHIEDRRKDHYQMFIHHIITCLLVAGSFAWSYTRLGHLIIVMMDFVDTWLSIAKCTKYLNMPSWITDGFFVVFLVSWVALRHMLYMYEIIYGAFPALDDLEGRCVFDVSANSLYAAPVQCFSKKVHYIFFALTLMLQAITIMWFFMILNVVARVINGEGAEDTRSDSEDD